MSLPSHRAAPEPQERKKRRRPGMEALAKRLKRKHPRCQACLFDPPPEVRGRALNVHHVTPKERGGTDDEDNLLVLCARCHALAHSLLKKRPANKWRLLRRLIVIEDRRQR